MKLPFGCVREAYSGMDLDLKSIEVSLITVNNIIVVTYCSKCHRLSLSLIAANETPLIEEP